jgi:DNA-binding winged helix-turn-helix (wHTH) protein
MHRLNKPSQLAHTALVSIGCAVVLCLVGLAVVHSVLTARAGELRDRSLLYALAIARDVQSLIGTSGDPDLTSFAAYVRLSGLLYAQVVSGDEVLLEICIAEGAEAFLRTARQVARLPEASIRRIRDRLAIDVSFPYGPTRPTGAAQPIYSVGVVHLGIDASDLGHLARHVTAWASIAGGTSWLLASAALFAVRRRRTMRTGSLSTQADTSPPSVGRIRSAGDLTLFYDASRLDVAGHSVDLTPKLRDVLWLLFSSPGRAFSDAEILAEVWRDSPYADSRDVKQHVYLIRRRLAAAGLSGDRILVNVPGLGYRVVSDPAERLLDARIDPHSIDAPPSKSKDE